MIISVLIQSNDQFGTIYFWSAFNGRSTREALKRAKEEYNGTRYEVIEYKEGRLSSALMHQIFNTIEAALYSWEEELLTYRLTPTLNATMH